MQLLILELLKRPRIKTATNIGLAIWWLKCFADTLVFF
jgi:hypothetical protein